MTSDQLLEGSDTLYESLVIMGGGVIGVEFATFYANLAAGSPSSRAWTGCCPPWTGSWARIWARS